MRWVKPLSKIPESRQVRLLDWIYDQVQAGATCDEICQALEPAMRL